ncbi:MAG: hypothetical protein D9V44_03190 [Actinobacteria bacterium]|nr:MAG: hypothetical protein D9V44_03190 [Actinomycetota bacterium]
MSDQDFFFDEEEDAKPTPKKAQGKQGQTPARSAAPAQASFFAQDVPMLIAALMTVIALLVGLLVGLVIPTGGQAGVSNTAQTGAAVGAGTAPQLTQDQINSGQIPPNHPDLSGMTGSGTASGSASATGSATTTSN